MEYEFSCPHLLSVSDCESVSVGELLKMADHSVEDFCELRLGYTESLGKPSLRERIAARYRGVSPEHTLLLNSPIEGLFLISQIFTGKTAVLLPAYDALKNLPQEFVGWQLKPVEGGWALDWEALDELSHGVELLVVNFPHNPTGFQPSPEDWERLVEWARKREIWLFCDEMYRGLDLGHPILDSAVELYEKSLVLNGLSKPQGLPGLRAGWIVCKQPHIVQKLLNLRLYTSMCTPAPVEFLAEVALAAESKLLERNASIIKQNLELAEEFFQRHTQFDWRPPLSGSIALAELPSGQSAEAYCHKLATERGVVLLPSAFLGVEDKYVRFGFGRESFGEALSAFEQTL